MNTSVGGAVLLGDGQTQDPGEDVMNANSVVPQSVVEPTHAVQFYDDVAFLGARAADFLVGPDPFLVIAGPATTAAIRAALEARGQDAYRGHFLDAQPLLDRVLVAGRPDRARFRSAVIAELSRLRLATGGVPRIRAYGELVDLLVAAKNVPAALEVEALWNELAAEQQVSLLCGYRLDGFASAADSVGFLEVCGCHAEVHPVGALEPIASGEAHRRQLASLQQRARALETELAQRQQLERALWAAVRARDEFLALAAHELNTPLTALQLQVQALQHEAHPGTPPHRVERVAHQVTRLVRLAEELLDVTRLGAGRLSLNKGEVELGALLAEAVAAAQPDATHAGCELLLHPVPPVVGQWDAARLGQVLAKLLGNAVKYGGARVELFASATATHARVLVRDQGAGIAPEDQARIFGRFERAVSLQHFGGLGVGLWIARQVVEAHHGQLRVESEVGRGSTFILELPR